MLEFKINGRKVPLNRMADELTRSVNKELQNKLEDRARSARQIRCPVHGGVVTVTSNGRFPNNQSYEFSGCCEELVQRARADFLRG